MRDKCVRSTIIKILEYVCSISLHLNRVGGVSYHDHHDRTHGHTIEYMHDGVILVADTGVEQSVFLFLLIPNSPNHLHARAHPHTQRCTHAHTHTPSCTHTHECSHKREQIHTRTVHTHTHTDAHTHTCLQTRTYTYVHICTYTHVYHIHAHTHTHTHKRIYTEALLVGMYSRRADIDLGSITLACIQQSISPVWLKAYYLYPHFLLLRSLS
jgi:hypothetical protein